MDFLCVCVCVNVCFCQVQMSQIRFAPDHWEIGNFFLRKLNCKTGRSKLLFSFYSRSLRWFACFIREESFLTAEFHCRSHLFGAYLFCPFQFDQMVSKSLFIILVFDLRKTHTHTHLKIKWESLNPHSIRFDSIRFDSIRFDSIRFDSIRFD